MTLRILATADIHLGRRPIRLPEVLTEQIPPNELGPATAWDRLVDLALEEGVHALLLAGDVVESEFDFFEAYGEIKRGVARLSEAGVRVLAVSGNHDTRVLPSLADEMGALELLGRGGVWEPRNLSGGSEEVTIWGWSFQQALARRSPLESEPPSLGPGLNLGLLHCDRDQTNSPYAPVSSAALEEAGMDAWFLGHIHRPDSLTADHPVGYLGSLTGLGIGEPGPHGPWMVSVDEGRISDLQQLPIAPLRWERVEVDVEGLPDAEAARGRVLESIAALDEQLRTEEASPLAVGLRLTFAGHTGLREELEMLFTREELGDIDMGGTIQYFVAGPPEFETLPLVDLAALSLQADPAGLLARRLVLLERQDGDPERRALLEEARKELTSVEGNSAFKALGRDPSSEAELADLMLRAGRLALDQLLSGKEGQ